MDLTYKENSKNKKRRSIRKQIVALVMGSVFFALAVTTMSALFFMQKIRNVSERALTGQMEEQLLQLAVSSADLTDEEIKHYLSSVKLFSRYAEEIYSHPEYFLERPVYAPMKRNDGHFALQRYYASEQIDKEAVRDETRLLANMESIFAPFMYNEQDMVSDIYIATKKGVFISYNSASLGNRMLDDEYFNYFEREWYKRAIESGDTGITSVYMDSFKKGATISCSTPVMKDGETVAVLSMDILTKNLQEEMQAMKMPQGAYVFVITDDGQLIADTRLEGGVTEQMHISAGEYGDETIIERLLSGKEGVTLASDGNYYAYSPIVTTRWAFCVSIPQTYVLAPLSGVDTNVRIAILDFVIFSLMFCGVLLYLTSHYSEELLRPIRELKEDVDIISSGNLNWKVEIRNNDEIGDLGEAFNRMTDDLRTYIADLTRVTGERERIRAELDVAARIQRDMLISTFPAFPDRKEFDLYATMRPAKEVGGDFYDFYMIDDHHLALAIADVSGKGVPAALFMMMSMLPLRGHAKGKSSPAEVIGIVNNILCKRNDESMFVTVWLGFLDLRTGKMVCANAGHEYPMLRHPGGEYELIKDPHGLAAGVMEDVRYRDYELQLEPGSDLFVYSDGLPEGINEENVQFGTDGILRTLNGAKDLRPEVLLPLMQEAEDTFAGTAPQFDDITMMGLHWNGPAQEL